MKKSKRKSAFKSPFNLDPAIALDPFGLDDGIQVIGTPEQLASGAIPRMREMTLDDIEDDCPICMFNRQRILDGNAPMVMAFD